MKKEAKKLLAYLLALGITVSTVCTGETAVKAAALAQNGTTIAETTDAVSVVIDGEGQYCYTLTSDITDGLEVSLSDGETAVLDGKGFLISGKAGYNYWKNFSSPALKISGEGTLILKNIRLTGGKSYQNASPSPAILVEDKGVSLILQETVTITGGGAGEARTSGGTGADGVAGIEFHGTTLMVDSSADVTMEGASGYQGGE